MAIVYKTICEIKLMHEYYCTRHDGQSIFSVDDQPGRLAFLNDQFARGFISINNDLSFEFPPDVAELYAGYYLKIIPAYSGCRIVARVTPSRRADGSTVYKSFNPFPDDLNIKIIIRKNNPSIDRYSNARNFREIPATYFFTNTANNIDAPFLTKRIAPWQGDYSYEQGQLALHGPNDIRYYYRENTDEFWIPVTGKAFVNEADRQLLPTRFIYSFKETDRENKVDFTIKDSQNNIVKTISVQQADPLKRVVADFSSVADRITLPFSGTEISNILEISGSNGYNKQFPVVFNDQLSTADTWGVVNLHSKPSNASFHLFDDDGFLWQRIDSSGIREGHPVFEIHVSSRLPFWRFINNRGRELVLTPELSDYVMKENKMLVTKQPKAVTRSYFFLTKPGSNLKKYLPNPLNYEMKKDSKQRWCFDIMVPQSELFPVI